MAEAKKAKTETARTWTPKTLYKHVAGFVAQSRLDPKTATIDELFGALRDAEFADIDGQLDFGVQSDGSAG